MSQDENAQPKKKFKKWQIVVIVLIALAVIGQFTGGGDTSSTEKTPQTTVATAAPEPEVDLFTERACRKFREFLSEAGKGIFTNSELRAEFQDTYQAARFSESPVITEAATRTLAALTAVDSDALSVWGDLFVEECKELGQ